MLQAAVGMFFMFSVSRLILTEESVMLASIAMILTGPVVLTGMIASVFHLGNPFRAYRSVTNMGKSWLSREIFFTTAFFGLWCVCFLMEQFGNSSVILIWGTLGTGLIAVWSMAGIYCSTGRPGWNSINTFIDFFGTTLIFGTMVFVMIFSSQKIIAGDKFWLTAFIVLSALILTVRFVVQLKMSDRLISSGEGFSMDNLVSVSQPVKDITPRYKKLIVLGFISTLSGLGLIALVMFATALNIETLLLILSMIFILTGETLSRSAFYLIGLTD